MHGAFTSNFCIATLLCDDTARFDLDMANYSLFKSYAGNKHGITYPDMTWEPKESFRAVPDYYEKH